MNISSLCQSTCDGDEPLSALSDLVDDEDEPLSSLCQPVHDVDDGDDDGPLHTSSHQYAGGLTPRVGAASESGGRSLECSAEHTRAEESTGAHAVGSKRKFDQAGASPPQGKRRCPTSDSLQHAGRDDADRQAVVARSQDQPRDRAERAGLYLPPFYGAEGSTAARSRHEVRTEHPALQDSPAEVARYTMPMVAEFASTTSPSMAMPSRWPSATSSATDSQWGFVSLPHMPEGEEHRCRSLPPQPHSAAGGGTPLPTGEVRTAEDIAPQNMPTLVARSYSPMHSELASTWSPSAVASAPSRTVTSNSFESHHGSWDFVSSRHLRALFANEWMHTQKEFAKARGIPYSSLSAWLRGTRVAPCERVVREYFRSIAPHGPPPVSVLDALPPPATHLRKKRATKAKWGSILAASSRGLGAEGWPRGDPWADVSVQHLRALFGREWTDTLVEFERASGLVSSTLSSWLHGRNSSPCEHAVRRYFRMARPDGPPPASELDALPLPMKKRGAAKKSPMEEKPSSGAAASFCGTADDKGSDRREGDAWENVSLHHLRVLFAREWTHTLAEFERTRGLDSGTLSQWLHGGSMLPCEHAVRQYLRAGSPDGPPPFSHLDALPPVKGHLFAEQPAVEPKQSGVPDASTCAEAVDQRRQGSEG
eukprot:TRINITY_DN801_c0_g3_i1.p1 TRINITY_DN801_c0_g3~~TRINITY_DN801_c0_g3_i1.p1  ORF type:complete len:672 (-),score=60.82 TRINITY_DN801_c0_g3_i1:314-2266(-)